MANPCYTIEEIVRNSDIVSRKFQGILRVNNLIYLKPLRVKFEWGLDGESYRCRTSLDV